MIYHESIGGPSGLGRGGAWLVAHKAGGRVLGGKRGPVVAGSNVAPFWLQLPPAGEGARAVGTARHLCEVGGPGGDGLFAPGSIRCL